MGRLSAQHGRDRGSSFITSQNGKLYEKDLGPRAADAGGKIRRFDPRGWRYEIARPITGIADLRTLNTVRETFMNQSTMRFACVVVAAIFGWLGVDHAAIAQGAKPRVIHDSEYYILEAQHGQEWAAQDVEINQKLAELRKKYGAPPNIIHIMWDDMAVGEVGIPAIQKVHGFETPNINRLAAEGINFMRMQRSSTCTPIRARKTARCCRCFPPRECSAS
jgi:hypothetical protein